MKTFKVVLVLTLVFLAGAAGGVVATHAAIQHFVNRAIADPDVVARLSPLGVTPATGSSEEFAEFLRADVDKWTTVLRVGNIKLGG